ncbi:uncharacterized protein LOC124277345 [Haliotis rubra]|uniref:uncharacterized protein LOC124277345 n=1 Tax=Haliotis rubra TaxID=36100 RepID=UPI001EE5DF0D|nr:uncharacterized protein LOC124277345 [Haliotis rubra]
MANQRCMIAEVNNSHIAGKRRRLEDYDCQVNDSCDNNSNGMISGNNHFFPIRRSNCVFHTEEWNSTGTALFKPLFEDLLINSLKHDQISCGEGDFFIADDQGSYSQTVPGRVLHLWKYDKLEKKLYISRSFLFTNLQEYMTVQQFLQRL